MNKTLFDELIKTHTEEEIEAIENQLNELRIESFKEVEEWPDKANITDNTRTTTMQW